MVVFYPAEEIKCWDNSLQNGTGASNQLQKYYQTQKKKDRVFRKLCDFIHKHRNNFVTSTDCITYRGESVMQNRFSSHLFGNKIKIAAS